MLEGPTFVPSYPEFFRFLVMDRGSSVPLYRAVVQLAERRKLDCGGVLGVRISETARIGRVAGGEDSEGY